MFIIIVHLAKCLFLEQSIKSTATHKVAWVYNCTIQCNLRKAHQGQLVPQYIYKACIIFSPSFSAVKICRTRRTIGHL